ncbi:hypothetical protein HBH45_070260 [Parastagonospora nodorum]|nr:hypothetical protein HBH45_070260 [Parastagonospora nodorum]KAH4574938.1 hypothetical protein HBH84_084010 [Parastagonospora nodorum]KAH5016422.1 hypothetical protein HBI75_183030 [Parastagonospora nodorum]
MFLWEEMVLLLGMSMMEMTPSFPLHLLRAGSVVAEAKLPNETSNTHPSSHLLTGDCGWLELPILPDFHPSHANWIHSMA